MNKLIALILALNIASAQGLGLNMPPAQTGSASFNEAINLSSLGGTPDMEEKTMAVTLTAYSSTEDQTDDTPFISASGKRVHDGMIAANFLKFGTKVKIPALFGDKVFTVNDRMHRRFSNRVDIWFADRESAVKFGLKTAEIVILSSSAI